MSKVKLAMSSEVSTFEKELREFMRGQNLRILVAFYNYPSGRFEMKGCAMSLSKIEDCLIEIEEDDDFYYGEVVDLESVKERRMDFENTAV